MGVGFLGRGGIGAFSGDCVVAVSERGGGYLLF